MIRKLVHIAILILLSISLRAQLNLVPNPSFEEHYSCPTATAEIDKNCKSWFTPMGISPDTNITGHFAGGSSDYFHSCSSYEYCKVPKNGYGFQLAHSGNAYAGIYLHYPLNVGTMVVYKEYIEIELMARLRSGYQYQLEFHYSISRDIDYQDIPGHFYQFDIQALLTDTLLYRINDLSTPEVVENINAHTPFSHLFPPTVDTTSWFKASFEFEANGGEKFLTIGNFKDYPFVTDMQGAVVYIDDVSLTYIGPDTTPAIPEISLYPVPAKDEIHIKQETGSLQGTRFELYDLTGRQVIHYTIAEDNKEIKLPVWHLASSMYVYAIRKNGILLKKDKLIVVR